MINYYESLGLEPNATDEDIKAAYRQLAKRHHPDIQGGDPVRFARITEAYEVLSDSRQRRQFDEMLKAREQRRRVEPEPQFHARPRGMEPGEPGPSDAGDLSGFDPFAPRDLGPPFTRVMSLAMPGNGRFLLEGLNGEFIIRPNRVDKIWETTAKKFQGEAAASLVRRVIQIRLHGPREVVKHLRPIPTEFGVQLQGGAREDLLGGDLGDMASAGVFLGGGARAMEALIDTPIKMTVTLPEGVPLYLYDLSGKVNVGDLGGELVATLQSKTILRAGKVGALDLTLNGTSKAYVSGLHGSADVMAFGQSQFLLDGEVAQLRTVLEHESHVEVLAKVGWLQAAVSGRAYLNMKGPVEQCNYDLRAGGYMKLAKVEGGISGSRSGAAGIDVLSGAKPGTGAHANFGAGFR